MLLRERIIHIRDIDYTYIVLYEYYLCRLFQKQIIRLTDGLQQQCININGKLSEDPNSPFIFLIIYTDNFQRCQANLKSSNMAEVGIKLRNGFDCNFIFKEFEYLY